MWLGPPFPPDREVVKTTIVEHHADGSRREMDFTAAMRADLILGMLVGGAVGIVVGLLLASTGLWHGG